MAENVHSLFCVKKIILGPWKDSSEGLSRQAVSRAVFRSTKPVKIVSSGSIRMHLMGHSVHLFGMLNFNRIFAN